MALEGTQQQYYGEQSFTSTAAQTDFVLTFPNTAIGGYVIPTMPQSSSEFSVFIDGVQSGSFTYDSPTLTMNTGQDAGVVVVIRLINPSLGNYQYIKLNAIINNFIVSYIGQDKIIPRTRRADVAFHAQRGIQELSYDTLRSNKSQEIEVPLNLKMALPHDYVNYQKVSWKDADGVERIIYPVRQTSNPTAILQDDSFGYIYDSAGNLTSSQDSDTWADFKNSTAGGDTGDDDAISDEFRLGGFEPSKRYGIEPEMAQGNGSYYIDNARGYINFSSDMISRTVTLHYISDGLGTEDEMIVHKFAEEAIYKYIAHALLATKANVQEYVVARFKKEKSAAIRTAKIRLSNLKLDELSQVMRGKSKWLKH